MNETEVLIAAPGERAEQLRSGTWSMVRYAHRGKPGATTQVWSSMPVKHPTAEQIAGELYAALQKNCSCA